MGALTATVRGTKCWKMETPAVAGASLRFTTVIDFGARAKVPVNHTQQFNTNNSIQQDNIMFYLYYISFRAQSTPFISGERPSVRWHIQHQSSSTSNSSSGEYGFLR